MKALKGSVSASLTGKQVSTSDMERALAAEERRSFLIPHCR